MRAGHIGFDTKQTRNAIPNRMVVVARRDLSRRAEIMWKTRISLAQVGELNSHECHILQGLLWGALGLLLGSPRAPFGAPLGSFGVPLGSFGAPLGSFGALLGSFGVPLGCPWAPLGCPWAPLGCPWDPFGWGGANVNLGCIFTARSAFLEFTSRSSGSCGSCGSSGSGVMKCC